MAVCPYQVQTPPGPVRILVYPRLETAREELDGEEARRAAEAYVRSTTFRHPADIGERLGSLAEPIGVESDHFRDDICADASHAGRPPIRETKEVHTLRLVERRIEVGKSVCAAGYYSAAKKALVPAPRGGPELRISTRSPEAWSAETREWGTTYVRWGIGSLTVFALACAFALVAW
jgi:hypothetical protein